MKQLFALAILAFLYTPLLWYSGTGMRNRDFLSLSFLEMLVAAFFTIMPIVIVVMLEKKKAE